jgi:glycosyltransferase involved in cell wall biosynthesis
VRGATQVRPNVNALLFDFSDVAKLADHLRALLDDPDRQMQMGRNSRKVFECLLSYDDMLERYEQLVVGASVRGMDATART